MKIENLEIDNLNWLQYKTENLHFADLNLQFSCNLEFGLYCYIANWILQTKIHTFKAVDQRWQLKRKSFRFVNKQLLHIN